MLKRGQKRDFGEKEDNTIIMVFSLPQTTLYSWIWACRYMALCLGLAVYFFNWLKHSSPVHRNMVMLKEIQRDIRRLSHRVSGAVMESFLQTAPDSRQHTRMENHGTQKSDTTQSRGSFTKAMSVHSEPPLSPSTNWRMNKYCEWTYVTV